MWFICIFLFVDNRVICRKKSYHSHDTFSWAMHNIVCRWCSRWGDDIHRSKCCCFIFTGGTVADAHQFPHNTQEIFRYYFLCIQINCKFIVCLLLFVCYRSVSLSLVCAPFLFWSLVWRIENFVRQPLRWWMLIVSFNITLYWG